MSRAQQIAYLVARLRLLNCFQWSQPGRLDYFERQSAEPRGMTADSSSGGFRRSGTPVINPAVELMGDPDGRADAGRRPRGMVLTVADIQQLALGLREDWSMLAVSYWRSFHSARQMHVTSELLGWMINEVAKRYLIDPGAWEALDAAAREKEIARVIAWARAHSEWSEAELLVASLEDSLKTGPRWGVPASSPVSWDTVMSHASRLVELKDARAVPVLLRCIKSEPDGEKLERILAIGRDIRTEAFRDVAAAYLTDARPGVRAEAGVIRLMTGDKEGGRRVLARLVAAADDYNLAGDHLKAAVEGLLADGTAESRAIAQSLFAPARDERSVGDSVKADLARLFARHGLADPLRHYRRMLDRAGNRRGDNGSSVAAIYTQITSWLAPADPEMIRIKASGATAADSLPALRKWLDAKIADPATLPQPPR